MRTGLCLLGLLFTLSQPLGATVVQFHSEGTIFHATGIGVSAGDSISAIFSYDTEVSDSNVVPTFGFYSQTSPPAVFTIRVDGMIFSSGANFNVQIENDHIFAAGGERRDFVSVSSQNGVSSDISAARIRLGYVMPDLALTALPDDSLPLSLDLDDFSNAPTISVRGFDAFDNRIFDVTGTAESLTRIPEPAGVTLVILGMIALMTRRIRSA